MSSKRAWNGFPKIQNSEELSLYLKREYEHSKYIHYTRIDAIEKILKNREFWISDVRAFNDRKDAKQFCGMPYFALCFSTGVNENLPLWYLYSGIDGKGGCICFTKARIKKLVQDGKYELWEFDGANKVKKICDIENGNNATIDFVDVLYADSDMLSRQGKNKNVALKYNTMTNYNISQDEFKAFKNNHCGCVKGLAWYYEKETRLLVRLNDELGAKIDYNNTQKYKVVLNFSHVSWKELSVLLAPGYTDYSEIDKNETLKAFYNENSKISLSVYNGDIDFRLKERLCCNCEKRND